MTTNISKSVARAFRVLEVFRDRRSPMTAAEIQRSVGMPQPSARVLVKELVTLGYLGYATDTRQYFPTTRLAELARALLTTPVAGAELARSVEAIAAECGETTSLCGIRAGRVDVLSVERAAHPLALQLDAGLGATLWRTAVGRTLLSQGSPAEVAEYFGSLRDTDVPGRRQRQDVDAQLVSIRAAGYFIRYDVFLQGVGAVCVPVPRTAGAAALVIAVAGGKDRISARERPILRAIRSGLRAVTERRR